MSGLSCATISLPVGMRNPRENAASNDIFLTMASFLLCRFRRLITAFVLTYSFARALTSGSACAHRRGQYYFAGAKIFSRFMHCTKQRRPVFKIGCKDLPNHDACEFGYETVEQHGRIPPL